ncbi:MAG: hypothetical protein ACOCRN_02825 [Spirochaetia bacterium]
MMAANAQDDDTDNNEQTEPEAPEGPSGPTRPEDTDILLPSEILQVEDIDLEVVEAPLPEFAEPPLPDLAIPLPGPEQLEITQAALDIAPGSPGVTEGQVEGEQRSLYSTGRVAVGSRNFLSGDIGIFSFGTDPEFNLQYRHEGIDGYAENAPGTGYFTRNDRISGELDAALGTFDLLLDASFEEQDDGLQRESDSFYSVDQRYVSGGTRVRRETEGPFAAELGGSFDTASRVFVSDSDESVSERALEVAGEAGASLEFERGDVELLAGYLTRQSSADSFTQVVTGNLSGEYAFEGPLACDALAGISWEPDEAPLFPFELGVSATFREVFTLELRGGGRALRPSFTDVWREVPSAGLEDEPLQDGVAWFANTSVNWLASSTLTLESSTEAEFSRNAIDFAAFTPDTARHPIEQRDIDQVRSNVSVSWAPSRVFRLVGGYTGRLIDRRAIDPTHEIDMEVEVNTEEDRAGGRLGVVTPIFEYAALPNMSASGFFGVAEGIEVGLEFYDILGPVREQPRARFGATASGEYPFIEPGFRATMFARLSL